MKNIRLNPGGVMGALLLTSALTVTVLLTSNPDDVGRRVGGFGVLAVFLGAYGGNYLWDRLFPKSK